ncbi:MAG: PAS domain S-box protein [Parafilimonas terrae]|nr:PAS domain S-box protein [Parafilimonas terrae]
MRSDETGQALDDLLRLAAELCKVARGLICLRSGGRLQLRASYSAAGNSAAPVPAIRDAAAVPADPIVVPDLRTAPDRDRLLVAGDGPERFYVAVPLHSSPDRALGVVILLDDAPRPDGLTEVQQACLSGLARQAVRSLEARQAEQEHHGLQILHQRILDSVTDSAIIAMDRHGRVTRWNIGAERILGWREDAMLGRSAHGLFTPEDRAGGRPEIEMALALKTGRATGERWYLRRNGERFFASSEIMPLKDEAGAVLGFLKILRDRSQQRADEAALHKVQDQLRLAVAATDVGIFDYDLITDHLGWDARMCALFGLPPDAAVNYETFLAGLHPDDRPWVDEAVKDVLDPRGNGAYDIAYRTIGLEDGIERWVSAKGQVFFAEGRAVRFIGTVHDITARKRAEEHQRLLTAELQHRVKNTLAMVQAIASQTLRGAADLDEAREAFAARLISLGRAHDILTQASWTEAPIADIVAGALMAHRDAGGTRIRTGGPNVLLAAKPALSLALALHELATNAAKYGALSTEGGFVDLRWHVTDEDTLPRFCLMWSEHGGPPILTPPTRRGFGSRLIERSFAAEGRGEVAMTYAPTGFVCRLAAPLASLQD